MTLPELALQIGYGRIGWAIVATAAILHFIPAARRLSRARIWVCLLLAFGAAFLPGEASYAYWLGLAFQYPSGLLTGCCIASIALGMQGDRPLYQLPAPLALTIAPVGALLYLDAVGLLNGGFYFQGFSTVAAPVVALLATAACIAAIVRTGLQPSTFALLTAMCLFTLLRLPSGNLWDALLDPLLWGWACCSVFAMLRKGSHARRTVASGEPALDNAPAMATAID